MGDMGVLAKSEVDDHSEDTKGIEQGLSRIENRQHYPPTNLQFLNLFFLFQAKSYFSFPAPYSATVFSVEGRWGFSRACDFLWCTAAWTAPPIAVDIGHMEDAYGRNPPKTFL